LISNEAPSAKRRAVSARRTRASSVRCRAAPTGTAATSTLLVDTLPGATLFDLGGLQDELESLLGVHVDLLTPVDLPAKFRAQVLAEAQPV
jgi:predicted nucleotidyltransferase